MTVAVTVLEPEINDWSRTLLNRGGFNHPSKAFKASVLGLVANDRGLTDIAFTGEPPLIL